MFAPSFASEEQTRAYHEASFSLVFQGPLHQPFEQGSYTMEHTRIGPFPLFIVPMQATQDAMYYEAMFNRIPV